MFKPGTFRLLNSYINQTEYCINDKGRLYLISDNSRAYSRAKTILEMAKKGGYILTVSLIIVVHDISISVPHLLVGLINVSNFILLINLLNIRLGLYFDLIYHLMTETSLVIDNLVHSIQGNQIYSQVHSAVNSRFWKFITEDTFQMVYYSSLCWLLTSDILKIVLRLIPLEDWSIQIRKSLTWIKRKTRLLFISFMDFNFLGVISVCSGIVLQPKHSMDTHQRIGVVFSNLIMGWGVI